jgi:cytochrome c biogenesis protein
VVAHSFHDAYYDNGAPKDYVSDLEVFKDGQSIARQEIRVNEPLILDDVWFHQSFFGVGADMVVTEGDAEVFSETVAMAWRSNDGTRTIGQFTIPSKGLSVYVVQAASGKVLPELPAGSVALEISKVGSTTQTVQVLSQGSSVQAEGLTWTFERNRQYTGVTIKKDPGSNLVWLGSALLILGSCLVFFLPHRRVWARVRPNADGTPRVMLGAPNKRDPGLEPVFADLLHHIQNDDAQPER